MIKNFISKRFLGVRTSIIMASFFGISVLLMVTFSEHRLATTWPIQIAKDVAVAVIGLILLYASHLLFNHIRVHELKTDSRIKYTNQHIAFAIAMLFSCAFIIGSALQSAV